MLFCEERQKDPNKVMKNPSKEKQQPAGPLIVGIWEKQTLKPLECTFMVEMDYLTKTRHCSVKVSPFSVVRNSYNGGMQTIDKKSMKHAAFTFTFMEVDVAV